MTATSGMSAARSACLLVAMLLVASSCGTESTEFGDRSDDYDAAVATTVPIDPPAAETTDAEPTEPAQPPEPTPSLIDPTATPAPTSETPEEPEPVTQPVDPDASTGSGTNEPDLSGGWMPLQPRNDLTSEQSTNPEEIVVGPDGDTLLVRFWSGVEPCFGARVEVTEAADLIEVHLITGLPPGAEVTTCIAMAVAYEIEVPLRAPVGDRQILAVSFAPAPGVPDEPDGAVFETDQYLGLTLDEAEALAVVEGRVLRVARLDGESFALTEDFRPSRVNIEVEAGVVVAATGG